MISQYNNLAFIGYASGIAAGDKGCADGPLLLEQSDFIAELLNSGLPSHWETILKPVQLPTKLQVVAEICQRLAQITQNLTFNKQSFAVIGGDHSCAIGTWSGVATVCSAQGALGLVWIDAHMDSHTFETTESGNIHGMPLATLLGYGESELTHVLAFPPKLKPEHVSLIGVRSYESGEAALLERLGVRVYKMDEVQQRGINKVLQEAIARAKHGTVGFGVSLDLDGIDPIDAPGVGSPEPHGLSGIELCAALTQLRHDNALFGLEITEFNPYHDHGQKTQLLIKELLLKVFG